MDIPGESRLVDYVVIAGYDHHRGRRSRENGGGGGDIEDQPQDGGFHCQGTVLQRFPTEDWKDTPFTGNYR